MDIYRFQAFDRDLRAELSENDPISPCNYRGWALKNNSITVEILFRELQALYPVVP